MKMNRLDWQSQSPKIDVNFPFWSNCSFKQTVTVNVTVALSHQAFRGEKWFFWYCEWCFSLAVSVLLPGTEDLAGLLKKKIGKKEEIIDGCKRMLIQIVELVPKQTHRICETQCAGAKWCDKMDNKLARLNTNFSSESINYFHFYLLRFYLQEIQ